ncbi:MAG: recombinase RecA [Candidatus Gracilibacteria bacterium]|nr:recombinase RecA [Candidatus Gracilibacteria bacterium]
MGKAKLDALQTAISQIEKSYGKGSIMKLGENPHTQIEMTPTGSLSLDLAIGGGIPKGRIIEIFGPESSGKTTICLHMLAETQKKGGQCAFIDAEHALDPEYAKKIGVDIDNLLLSQPDTGEQALSIVETLVSSSAVDLIIVDSVAALTPRAEIEGDMGASHMGLQARLMSQALRKLTAIAARSGCTIIFINQLRMKIGVMFGNPETTTGGKALKFYSSIRLDIRSAGKIDIGTGDDKVIIGNHTKIKVVKNKIAPPFKIARFDIIYNEGISKVGDILDLGVKYEIIKKSGAFYSYGDERLGQGRENAKTALKDQPKMCREIDKKVRAAVLNPVSDVKKSA